MSVLDTILRFHQPTLVRVPGQGQAMANYCSSCTREPFPCPTVRAIDRERATQR